MKNVDPRLWGHSAWNVLHYVSFYSKSSIDDLRSFFQAIQFVLPCSKCRESYMTHLMNLPFPAHKDHLPKWLFLLHQRVNATIPGQENPSFRWVSKQWHSNSKQDISTLDGWPFLFAMSQAYPSSKENVQFRRPFQNAVCTVLSELSNTILENTPVKCNEWIGKRNYNAWLKETYQAFYDVQRVPDRLAHIGNGVTCKDSCKL